MRRRTLISKRTHNRNESRVPSCLHVSSHPLDENVWSHSSVRCRCGREGADQWEIHLYPGMRQPQEKERSAIDPPLAPASRFAHQRT